MKRILQLGSNSHFDCLIFKGLPSKWTFCPHENGRETYTGQHFAGFTLAFSPFFAHNFDWLIALPYCVLP
jgi:hypothetical protein